MIKSSWWLHWLEFLKDYKPSEETIKRHREKERLKQEAYENLTPEEQAERDESDRWWKNIEDYYFHGGMERDYQKRKAEYEQWRKENNIDAIEADIKRKIKESEGE